MIDYDLRNTLKELYKIHEPLKFKPCGSPFNVGELARDEQDYYFICINRTIYLNVVDKECWQKLNLKDIAILIATKTGNWE